MSDGAMYWLTSAHTAGKNSPRSSRKATRTHRRHREEVCKRALHGNVPHVRDHVHDADDRVQRCALDEDPDDARDVAQAGRVAHAGGDDARAVAEELDADEERDEQVERDGERVEGRAGVDGDREVKDAAIVFRGAWEVESDAEA
jgi:hypothetical protein